MAGRVAEVAVRVSADTRQAVSEITGLSAAWSQSARSARAAANDLAAPAKATGDSAVAARDVARAVASIGTAVASASSDLVGLARALEPAIGRAEQMAQAERTLTTALNAGVVSVETHNRLLGQARERYDDATIAARAHATQVSQAVASIGRAVAETNANYRQLAAALDPAIAKAQTLAAIEGQLDAAVNAGAASRDDANRLLALARQRYDETTVAARAHGDQATKAMASIGAAVAAANDDYRQLAAAMDPAVARAQALEIAQQKLTIAVNAGVASEEDAARVLALVNDRFDETAVSARAAADQVHALTAQYTPLEAAEQRHATVTTQVNKLIQDGHLGHVQGQAIIAGSRNQLDQYRQMQDKVAASSKATTFAGRQLALQFGDIAQSAALGMPPLQILLQQGPQVAGVFQQMGGAALRALVSPMALATAGFIGLAAAGALLIGRTEGTARALNSAQSNLTATGRAAELSRPAINKLIDDFARLPGASRDAAQGAVAALAGTRQVGVALFTDIAKAASDFVAVSNGEFGPAVEQISDWLKAPTQGAKAVADAYGALSVAQLQSIEDMERAGNRAGAQRVLLDAIGNQFSGLAKTGKTEMQSAADTIGKAWSDMWTNLANTGPAQAAARAVTSAMRSIADAARQQSIDEQIAELDRFLAKPPELGQLADGTTIYDRGRADYVDARRRRDRLDLERQARDAAGFDEATAFSFGTPAGGAQAANSNSPDATRVNDLIRQYDELGARRRQAQGDIDAIRAAMAAEAATAGQSSETYQQLDRALERAQGQYAAIKDGVDRARDATADEREIAQASVGTRAAVTAEVNAYRAAIEAGEGPTRAAIIAAQARTRAEIDQAKAANDNVGVMGVQIRGILSVAGAWTQGARAANQAAVAAEVASEAYGNSAVPVATLTKAKLSLNAANATRDGAKAVADLEQQAQASARLAEAERSGAAAVEEATVQNKVAAFALQLRATETDATRAANDRLIDSYERLVRSDAASAKAAQAEQSLRSLREQVAMAEAELRLAGELPQVRDREIARLRLIEDLKRRGIDLTSDQAREEMRLVDAISSAQAAKAAFDRSAEETNRIWTRAAEGIQDALTEAFEAAFDRSKAAGYSFGEAFKRFMLATASQIATAMVFKPVIGSIFSMAGAPASWLASQGYAAGPQIAQAAGAAGGGGFSFDPTSFMSPFSNSFMGIQGGISNILQPGAGWLGSMFPSVFGAGFAPVLGLEAGAASMGAAGLGLGAAEAAALGAGVAPGALAGMSGLLSVGLPIAAAIAIPLLSGMFADEQTPRGYAAAEIGRRGQFSASTVHQAGLDGYNNAQDRAEATKFATFMNTAMDKWGLSLAVDKDVVNHNGAYNGLLTIGSMYGGAANADELIRRWFTTDRSRAGGGANDNAGGAGGTEYEYQRSQGITTYYDRDAGMTYVDRDGRQIDQADYLKQYDQWRQDQAKASTPTGSGSLLKADDPYVQRALDRLAGGDLKVDDADQLAKYLDFAGGFGRTIAMSAAGPGTRQAQALGWKYAAEDQAKEQAKGLREMLTNADDVFGADSTEAKAAAAAAKQQALGLVGLGPDATANDNKPLTGFAATVAEAKAGFDALQPVLEAAGFSAQDAAAKISEGWTKRVKQLETDWAKDLTDQRQQATDPRGYARAQLDKADEQLRADAAQLGSATAKTSAEEFIAWRRSTQNETWAEEDRRVSGDLNQRRWNALAAINPRQARQAEDQARAEAQRRELWDAGRNGLTPAQIAEIVATQANENLAVAAQRARYDQRSAEDQALARNDYAVQAGTMWSRDAEDKARAARQRRAVEDATTDAEAAEITRTNAAENVAVAAQRAKADRRSAEDQALTRQGYRAEMGLVSRQQLEDEQRRIRQMRELEDATTAAEAAELRRTHAIEEAAVAYRRDMERYNQLVALDVRKGQAASSILRGAGGDANIAAANGIDRRLLEIQQAQELAQVTDTVVRQRMVETHALEAQALAMSQAAATAVSARDDFKGFAADIVKLRESLRVSELSPQSALQRLSEAGKQFRDTAAKAQAGDKEAYGELDGKTQAYLQLAKSVFQGNQQYAAIFSEVDGVLAGLGTSATNRASAAQQQLDLLSGQAVSLGNMATSLGNIERPVATTAATSEPALAAAKTTATSTEDLARVTRERLPLDKATADSTVDLARIAKEQLPLDKATADSGNRTAKAAEGTQTAVADLARAMATMPAPVINVAITVPPPVVVPAQADIPAFAAGGNYLGGVALVGEYGPELIDFNAPGRVYHAQDTAAFGRAWAGAGEAANDGEVVGLLAENAALQRQNGALLQQIARLLANSGQVAHNDATAARELLEELAEGATLERFQRTAQA